MPKCVICANEAQKKFFPFCSQRCRAIDLNRWLSGVYRIPVEDNEPEEQGEESLKNLEIND